MCKICTSHASKKKSTPVDCIKCVECGTNNHPDPASSVDKPFVLCRKCKHIIRFKVWDGFLCSPGLKFMYGL